MRIFQKIKSSFTSWNSLFGFFISFICLYWTFASFDWSTFLIDFKSIQFNYFILASLFLLLSVVIRSIRWRLFFNQSESNKVTLFGLFENQMIGYFANNILPLRLGDLFRIMIISRSTNISKSYLLGTVVVERLFDMISLFIFTFIFIGFYFNSIEVMHMLEELALPQIDSLLYYFIIFLVIFLFIYLFIKFKNIFDLNKFMIPFENVYNYIKMTKAIMLSLLIWLIYLINILIISYACGYNFSIMESLLLLSIITIIMTIPSAPGNIGTFQAAVKFVMISNLFGYNNQEAISFSIILHSYSYITYSLFGGLLFLKASFKGYED